MIESRKKMKMGTNFLLENMIIITIYKGGLDSKV